jgi:DNA repair exonuclease SbcCD ATPase subunit
VSFKLVVADRSITIQRVVQLTFNKRDIEIVVAQSPEHLQELLAEAPEILLLDTRFFPGDFDAAMGELRPLIEKGRIHTILMTSADDDVDLPMIQRWGVHDFLVKPLDNRELLSKVDNHLINLVATAEPAAEPEPAPAGAAAAVAPPGEELLDRLGERLESRMQEELSRLAERFEERLAQANQRLLDELAGRLGEDLRGFLEPLRARVEELAAGAVSAEQGAAEPGTGAAVDAVRSAVEGLTAEVRRSLESLSDGERLAPLVGESLQQELRSLGERLTAELAPAEAAAPDPAVAERVAERLQGELETRQQRIQELVSGLEARLEERLARLPAAEEITSGLSESLQDAVQTLGKKIESEVSGLLELALVADGLTQRIDQLASDLGERFEERSQRVQGLVAEIREVLESRLAGLPGVDQIAEAVGGVVQTGVREVVEGALAELRRKLEEELQALGESAAPAGELLERLDALGREVVAAFDGGSQTMRDLISGLFEAMETRLDRLPGEEKLAAAAAGAVREAVGELRERLESELRALGESTSGSDELSRRLEELDTEIVMAFDGGTERLREALGGQLAALEERIQGLPAAERVAELVRTAVGGALDELRGKLESELRTLQERIPAAEQLSGRVEELTRELQASFTERSTTLGEQMSSRLEGLERWFEELPGEEEIAETMGRAVREALGELRERIESELRALSGSTPRLEAFSQRVEELAEEVMTAFQSSSGALGERLAELSREVRQGLERIPDEERLARAAAGPLQEALRELTAKLESAIRAMGESAIGVDDLNQRLEALSGELSREFETRAEALRERIGALEEELAGRLAGLPDGERVGELLSTALEEPLAGFSETLESELEGLRAAALDRDALQARLDELAAAVSSCTAATREEIERVIAAIEQQSSSVRQAIPDHRKINDELLVAVQECLDTLGDRLLVELQELRGALPEGESLVAEVAGRTGSEVAKLQERVERLPTLREISQSLTPAFADLLAQIQSSIRQELAQAALRQVETSRGPQDLEPILDAFAERFTGQVQPAIISGLLEKLSAREEELGEERAALLRTIVEEAARAGEESLQQALGARIEALRESLAGLRTSLEEHDPAPLIAALPTRLSEELQSTLVDALLQGLTARDEELDEGRREQLRDIVQDVVSSREQALREAVERGMEELRSRVAALGETPLKVDPSPIAAALTERLSGELHPALVEALVQRLGTQEAELGELVVGEIRGIVEQAVRGQEESILRALEQRLSDLGERLERLRSEQVSVDPGPILSALTERLSEEFQPALVERLMEKLGAREEEQGEALTAELRAIIEETTSTREKSLREALEQGMEEVRSRLAALGESPLKVDPSPITGALSERLSGELQPALVEALAERLGTQEAELGELIVGEIRGIVEQAAGDREQSLRQALEQRLDQLGERLETLRSEQVTVDPGPIAAALSERLSGELQPALVGALMEKLTAREDGLGDARVAVLRSVVEEVVSSREQALRESLAERIGELGAELRQLLERIPAADEAMSAEARRVADLMSDRLLEVLLAEIDARINRLAGGGEQVQSRQRELVERVDAAGERLLAGVTAEIDGIRDELARLGQRLGEQTEEKLPRLSGHLERMEQTLGSLAEDLASRLKPLQAAEGVETGGAAPDTQELVRLLRGSMESLLNQAFSGMLSGTMAQMKRLLGESLSARSQELGEKLEGIRAALARNHGALRELSEAADRHFELSLATITSTLSDTQQVMEKRFSALEEMEHRLRQSFEELLSRHLVGAAAGGDPQLAAKLEALPAEIARAVTEQVSSLAAPRSGGNGDGDPDLGARLDALAERLRSELEQSVREQLQRLSSRLDAMAERTMPLAAPFDAKPLLDTLRVQSGRLGELQRTLEQRFEALERRGAGGGEARLDPEQLRSLLTETLAPLGRRLEEGLARLAAAAPSTGAGAAGMAQLGEAEVRAAVQESLRGLGDRIAAQVKDFIGDEIAARVARELRVEELVEPLVRRIGEDVQKLLPEVLPEVLRDVTRQQIGLI